MVPAVKAVIVQDGAVLLLQRAATETHLTGYWDVPGGRLDYGETPEAALHRETTEEAGVDVSIITPVNAWGFTRDDGLYIVGTTFLCAFDGGQPRPGDEHTEAKWVDYAALDDHSIHDGLRNGIDKAINELQRRQAVDGQPLS